MNIEYDVTGRITRTGLPQYLNTDQCITVEALPDDFSPKKYCVRDGALAVRPDWVELPAPAPPDPSPDDL